jgi:type II secretory pathway component PulL
MIRVEIVVAGALGDLVESMFPELVAERQQSTRVLVADQETAAKLMDTLGAAGIEVEQVLKLPNPSELPTAGEEGRSRP